MITRKSARILLLAAALSVPAGAHAAHLALGGGEMMSTDPADSMESPRGLAMDSSPATTSLGGDSGMPSYARTGAGDVSSSEESPAARGSDNDPPPAAAAVPPPRTAIPVATPSVPNRARSGNRWQSLVPGAIK